MDKKKIVELGIQKLRAKLELSEKTVRDTEEQRRDAPSAMQSWSDTTRFQTEAIISQMEEEKADVRRHLEFLESLDLREKIKAEKGVLVEVENIESLERKFYFISCCPGLEIEIGKERVIFISESSPLAKSLLGKKAEDEFEVKLGLVDKKLKIISTI
ncbi:MAG: GreA/GreB family elongation factor [Patescibacteria group bacterium]